VFRRQTIQVGSVAYKNCATVAISGQGLYLEVKFPFFSRLTPLLIPWANIQALREGSLYWRKAVTLCIGSPEIGTVTLFRDRLAQVRPYLPSDRQASLK